MDVPSRTPPATEQARRRLTRTIRALLVVAVVTLAGCARHPEGVAEPPIAPAPPGPEPPGPNRTNTGVPPGTVLRRSGSIVVRRDGTVIAARHIVGSIRVAANDVTIRDSRITSDDYWPIWLDPDNTGLVVRDTEVVGSGSCQAGIGTHDYHAIRIDVHGCGDGAKAGSHTTIEASWFHDLLVTPGSHNDGIQASAGTDIVLRGNRVTAPPGQSSAIMIGPDYGTPIVRVTIEDNLLDGGSYALHLDAHEATVRGNRFGSTSSVGPAVVVNTPSVWAGNILEATGRPVTP